ncbi:IS1 family transposase [Gillisia sp. Hel_I_86]|uniref:IS1 family transposase n=1 Tax=Gillisia sp. Hel_I_86 TaxID=1249981 RepID=UPI0016447762|nr:IS1 family transposase [Gillisia sp. Hel_I_86]
MDLRNILNDLDRAEKIELAQLLHRELNVPDLGLVGRDIGNDRPVYCPHCEDSDIYGHGHYKGRRRYKCRPCHKTFNDFTGTAVDGIKKLEKFQEYLLLVVESVTIRKAAEKIGVNVKTIFDWRHKLLSSLEVLNGTGFSGIVECDDKQLDINDKGRRNLGRDPTRGPATGKPKGA